MLELDIALSIMMFKTYWIELMEFFFTQHLIMIALGTIENGH